MSSGDEVHPLHLEVAAVAFKTIGFVATSAIADGLTRARIKTARSIILGQLEFLAELGFDGDPTNEELLEVARGKGNGT